MSKTNLEVANLLRGRINDGTYPPGSRLPTRTRLIEDLQTSTRTVQRALGQLIEEGYVTTNKKAGSFVTELPPNLSRICIFLPTSAAYATEHSLFYRSILKELPALEKKLNVSYEIMDCAIDLKHHEKLLQLVKDVQLNRLAGIFFLSTPGNFAGTPIYDTPGIARVAISNAFVYNIPAIYTDENGFYRRGLERLAKNGFRRPATINWQTATSNSAIVEKEYRALGLDFHPWLLQSPHISSPRNFTQLIELWHALPAEMRPDSLLINDDNHLNVIGETLRSLHWLHNAPNAVVALANFPWKAETSLPVTFLGYETDRVLEIGTRSLLRQSRGGKSPELTRLPAFFEDELKEESR